MNAGDMCQLRHIPSKPESTGRLTGLRPRTPYPLFEKSGAKTTKNRAVARFFDEAGIRSALSRKKETAHRAVSFKF